MISRNLEDAILDMVAAWNASHEGPMPLKLVESVYGPCTYGERLWAALHQLQQEGSIAYAGEKRPDGNTTHLTITKADCGS